MARKYEMVHINKIQQSFAVCSRVRWTDPSDKKFSVAVFGNVYIPFDLFSKESTA